MATLHQADTADQVINLYKQGHGEPNYYSLYLTTPLHSACQRGNYQVVKQLCELNANLSAENYKKELPIDEAVKFGDIKIVELIVKQMLCQEKNIVSVARETYKELHKTSTYPYNFFQKDVEKCAEYLIMRAPYYINCLINLSSSIHYAILYADHNILNYLMQFKFDLNDVRTISTQNNKIITGTPLMVACFTKNVKIVSQLLYAKSVTTKTDSYGATQKFFNPKVNVNYQDNKGRTALRKISKNGNADLISELITVGCDINLQCNKGMTPLMMATRYKNYDAVMILLSAGADTTIINNFGNRSIDYADTEIADTIRNYQLFN